MRPAEPPPQPLEPDPPARAAVPQPRKGKALRRLGWTLAVLVVLIVLLGIFAPTLLSTAPGNRVIEKIASGRIDGRVRLSGLSLGWASGIRLREAEVFDASDKQVLAVANFESGLTLWEAIRGNYELGDTSGRLNLTVLQIYDDGTTNLHDVFRIEPSADKQAQIPDIRGRLKFDGHAGVQYMGRRDVKGDESDAVDVNFDGTQIVLLPGAPLEHNVPLALRVSGNPAGEVLAKGTIDLATLSNERPVIQEEVTLTRVNLPAIGTLLSAFIPAMTRIEIAGGVVDGTLLADLAQNKLAGQITASEPIVINRRDVTGQGYQTDEFELVLNGGFADEPLPPEQHVTLEDGTKITSRLLVNLDQLAITTDDGTLTAAGLIDLFIMQTGPLANWPMLARDVSVDLKTDFATAQGQGANLGAFTLEGSADVARMNQRFGTLLAGGGAQPLEGKARLSLKTQPAQGGAVTVPVSLNIENLVLAKVEALQDESRAADAISEPARPAGAISADPGEQAKPRQPSAMPPTQNLHLGLVRLDATATIPPAKGDALPMPSDLQADLLVNDTQAQAIITAKLSADDLTADSAGGRIVLEELSLPDYARLRAALAGWVSLPEAHEPVEPITMTAAASWNGREGRLELAEPLRVLLGESELASVTASAQRQEEQGAWVISTLTANISVPAVDQLSSHFGSKVQARDQATGAVALRVEEERPLRFSTADFIGSLEGALTLAIENAAARGMTLSGEVPLALSSGTVAIPENAQPLTMNEGEVILAGTSLQKQGESWLLRLPEGDVVSNVSLNPVLMEFFGKYINPVFVQPEQATGLLDVQVASADTLDLSDFSKANLSLKFSIRKLRIDNDVIAQFTEASVGETASAIRGQLSAIPGVDRQIRDRIAGFSISEEIRQRIASIRGSVTDAEVSVRGGVADTKLTFNVADPRTSATQEGRAEVFPLTFTGGVEISTLSARNLSVTVPTSLIEKWAGENPEELVEIFGERPWPRLLPEGVRIGINGTTYLPVPDPQSFEALAREIAPRAAESLLQGQLEGVLRRLRGE